MDWLGLKEEHKMLRHDMKRFAETELEPTLLELDQKSTPHVDAFGKIGKLGMLGILVPEKYGGAEMDLLSLVVAAEELAKVSPSFALSVVAHNLFAHMLSSVGSDEMKQQFLPKLAEGKMFAGLGIGTMIHATDGDGGKTAFIVNGSFAHLIGYPVQDEQKSVFAIEELSSPLEPETELMGMRACGICMLRPEKRSSSRDMFQIDHPDDFFSRLRLLIAAISCGVSGSSLTHSISYAKERKQFDRPIASFGMVRIMLAEMAARSDASRMLLYQAAAEGTPLERDISAAFAVEHALVVSDHGVQIYGGYGYTKDYPQEMFFRDAKVLEIFAGSAESLKVGIGKQLIK